ncbi:MAG: BlaI/MecI/CopY family transcriptional regulator [Gemmatimonadota bacterium]
MPKPTDPEAQRSPELHLHDTVRLSADGLGKVLGDLEARVMRTVWTLGRPAPAREVHDRVFREHEVAHLTVVTVLNKLVEKGLLIREKVEGIFHYRACWSEEEFRVYVSRRLVEGILSFEPLALATSFVDVLGERDPAQLAELRRLIDERLRREDP